MILQDGILLYHGSYTEVAEIDLSLCAAGKDRFASARKTPCTASNSSKASAFRFQEGRNDTKQI